RFRAALSAAARASPNCAAGSLACWASARSASAVVALSARLPASGVAHEARTQSNESSASLQVLECLGKSILVRLKINHSETERQCGRTFSDTTAICTHPAKKGEAHSGCDEVKPDRCFRLF